VTLPAAQPVTLRQIAWQVLSDEAKQ
jgi:hypothetical protein